MAPRSINAASTSGGEKERIPHTNMLTGLSYYPTSREGSVERKAPGAGKSPGTCAPPSFVGSGALKAPKGAPLEYPELI